jgi:L-ascorbate metabolism protein UlaG (beta-lactamase superfamily)
MNVNIRNLMVPIVLVAAALGTRAATVRDADSIIEAADSNNNPSNTVKITPLGQRTGEYCARDRAMLFEDPTGIRILYDPGVTVAGGGDPRLGAVDAILVSHNHFDHIGYQRLTQNPDDSQATCGLAPVTTKTGNTTTAEIAAFKNSAVLVNGSMAVFLSKKIESIRGVAPPSCPSSDTEGMGATETVVPVGSPCALGLAFGSLRILTRAAGAPGVRINMVGALHSDSLFNPVLLFTAPLGGKGGELDQNGLQGYDGLASGFVLTFTNGLRVYLTGDTGPTSDMALVVRGIYHPNLAVANMDALNNMGPEEAAYAMKELVQPAAVIPSHAEEAVTVNGQLRSSTRTAEFIRLLGDMPAYLPLSGRTMEFNGNAQCTAGCARNSRRDID